MRLYQIEIIGRDLKQNQDLHWVAERLHLMGLPEPVCATVFRSGCGSGVDIHFWGPERIENLWEQIIGALPQSVGEKYIITNVNNTWALRGRWARVVHLREPMNGPSADEPMNGPSAELPPPVANGDLFTSAGVVVPAKPKPYDYDPKPRKAKRKSKNAATVA
jgi:hypothetical protein